MTSLNDCGNVNGEKTLCWRKYLYNNDVTYYVLTCVYREQCYVIITFDLTWTQSVRPGQTSTQLNC